MRFLRTVYAWCAFLFVGSCAAAEVPPQHPGQLTQIDRASRYLIAAPHGEHDRNTAAIVREFCAQVPWDCLIAEGFRRNGAMVNVNRPTEGRRLAETKVTPRAKRVYERYRARAKQLTPELALYVEVHGNAHVETRNTIDIATVGIQRSEARVLARALRKSLHASGLKLRVRVDVLEPIRYKASHARSFGMLGTVDKALHIELPQSARDEGLDKTIAALTAALPNIANELSEH